MGLKECDLRKAHGVPEDSRFIREEELIIGIETRDGSFDYGLEGQEFLRPDAKNVLPKDNSTGIK